MYIYIYRIYVQRARWALKNTRYIHTVAAPGGNQETSPPETRKNSKRLGPASTTASTLEKFFEHFFNFSLFFQNYH